MIGMAVRAGISMVWRERPPRTLVEQFEPIITGMTALVARLKRTGDTVERDSAELTSGYCAAAIVGGVGEMIAIVNDASMEGSGAGIDSAALLEVLESILVVTAIAARMLADVTDASVDCSAAAAAIYRRLGVWREFLRRTAQTRRIPPAPLRMMVNVGRAAGAADETAAASVARDARPQVEGSIDRPPPDDGHLMAAFLTLEERFERVWIDRP
jgi:hypothetical protein